AQHEAVRLAGDRDVVSVTPVAGEEPRVLAAPNRLADAEFGHATRPCAPPLSLRASWIARHTWCGVAGISMHLTPCGASPTRIGLMIAGGEPTQPDSPAPFTPSGLAFEGTS